jgi:hypothetical protein
LSLKTPGILDVEQFTVAHLLERDAAGSSISNVRLPITPST